MEIVSTIRAMWKLSGILAFSAVLTGCVVSIDPVVPESQATLDPRLLGNWVEVSGSDRVAISRSAGRAYAIEYSNSDGEVSMFGARLGQQGEYMVLDVWPAPRFEVSPWPEADLLFHRDPHWAGSDGAYSVDLGNGRRLWLFGDTWIDPSGRHTRRGAQMIGNSVAIQTGSDPSRAAMAFYWGKTADGRPASFFGEQDGHRFWPGQGVRLGDRLVLFLVRVRNTSEGLGFESAGWSAAMVENPDDEPSRWRVTWLETPPNPLGVNVAGILNWDGHVYVYGSQEPVKSHPIYVVRWPVEEVRKGNLRAPEWWAGVDLGWVADSSSTPRWPVFENGQSEFTVH